MRTYYECHVTFEMVNYSLGHRETIPHTEGWKFSRIDGDPVLGEGVKCYFTKQFRDDTPQLRMVGEMKDIQRMLEGSPIFRVLRLKIEHVIYDSKQDKVVL